MFVVRGSGFVSGFALASFILTPTPHRFWWAIPYFIGWGLFFLASRACLPRVPEQGEKL